MSTANVISRVRIFMNQERLTRKETPVAMQSTLRNLPPGIWALGLAAMFMDTSSELVHSLLPVFLVSVLGTSMVTIGFLEGIAEATAAITKIFSGMLRRLPGQA